MVLDLSAEDIGLGRKDCCAAVPLRYPADEEQPIFNVVLLVLPMLGDDTEFVGVTYIPPTMTPHNFGAAPCAGPPDPCDAFYSVACRKARFT